MKRIYVEENVKPADEIAPIRNFMYFLANYPVVWVDKCFGSNPHIIEKYYSIMEKHPDTLQGIVRFFFNLDGGNQGKMITWVNKNYSG